MWIKNLYSMFISKNNFEAILDKSIENIYKKTGKKIDHNENDKLFFETFNTIASQVFSVESKNPILQKQSPTQALNIINNIVIDELVNYVLIKKPILLKQPELVAREEQVLIQNLGSEHTTIEDILKISIDNSETKFTSPIDNIISINIVSLYMYTQDYLVTELNNILIIIDNNEEIIINIKPGNYTQKTLFIALHEAILKKTQKYVEFYVSNSDNTVFVSPEIEISYTNSTINNILGLGTDNPIKLIKRNKLQMEIMFGFENETNNFEYEFPLIINSNELENGTGTVLKKFKLNYIKKFRCPVDLSEIKIDFDKYNHRGYPYYLILEITRIT